MHIKENNKFQKLFLIFFPIVYLSGPLFTELFLLGVILSQIKDFTGIRKKIKNDSIFIKTFFILIFLQSFLNYPEINIKNILYIRFYFYYIFVSLLFTSNNDLSENINLFYRSLIYILCFLILFHIFQITTGVDTIDARITIPIRQEEIAVSIYTKFYPFIISLFLLLNSKERLSNFFSKYKNLIIFVIFLVPVVVLFSGERMNSIMLFGFLLFIVFKYKPLNFIYVLTTIIIIFFILFNFEYLENFNRLQYIIERYQIFFNVLNNNFLRESAWGNHFITAYNIFEDNILTGIGIKMFQTECINYASEFKYACTSHPHNLYLEIASESGILNLLIIIIILFNIIKIFFKYLLRKNCNNVEIFIFCLSICLLIYAFPFRSTGSFFNNYNSSFFWVYLSLLFTLNKNEITKK